VKRGRDSLFLLLFLCSQKIIKWEEVIIHYEPALTYYSSTSSFFYFYFSVFFLQVFSCVAGWFDSPSPFLFISLSHLKIDHLFPVRCVWRYSFFSLDDTFQKKNINVKSMTKQQKIMCSYAKTFSLTYFLFRSLCFTCSTSCFSLSLLMWIPYWRWWRRRCEKRRRGKREREMGLSVLFRWFRMFSGGVCFRRGTERRVCGLFY